MFSRPVVVKYQWICLPPDMNKKALTERDICTKFITPAIGDAGWDTPTQMREEVTFTAGRVQVRGQVAARSEKTKKRADYILYYKPNLPLAVVEAKDNNHAVAAGMQQAISYAETLDIPFVYASNGDAFVERDRTRTSGTIEREIGLDAFPSPAELWQRYCAWKELTPAQEQIITQEQHFDPGGKRPRYFQQIAINRTMEAIAKAQKRILLVMATGTGKTYTAFQIIWRFRKTRPNARILFLADRNILVDQTKTNDFQPFGGAMTKVTNRRIDTSYEVHLALYQAVSGTEEIKNIYKQFSHDFFDLVVVDECHRGSAAEDSAWREILNYFGSATHLGLTATPKETDEVSNIGYFGEPVYTLYSKSDYFDRGWSNLSLMSRTPSTNKKIGSTGARISSGCCESAFESPAAASRLPQPGAGSCSPAPKYESAISASKKLGSISVA